MLFAKHNDLDRTDVPVNLSIDKNDDAILHMGEAILASLPFGVPEKYVQKLTDALKALNNEDVIVAIAGGFNTGKSTFINRLAGEDIVPVADIPETGAPAWFSHGSSFQASVVRSDGSREAIEPSPEAISHESSLYHNGHLRPEQKLAVRIEIETPNLAVPNGMRFIDLPGLRESERMDKVAIEAALLADRVIWMFRSSPTFSEQDARAVGDIAKACGPEVISFVCNVWSPNVDKKAYRNSVRSQRRIHADRIRSMTAEFGVPASTAASLIMIDARAFNQYRFRTNFGGRALFHSLRKTLPTNSGLVRAARLKRLSSALMEIETWAVQMAAAEESRLYTAQKAHEEARDKIQQWQKTKSDLENAVSTSINSLANEILASGSIAATSLSIFNYTPGEEVTETLVDSISHSLNAGVVRLTESLIVFGEGPYADNLKTVHINQIQKLLTDIVSDADEDDLGLAIEESVRAAIPRVFKPNLKMSLSRMLSWLDNKDDEIRSKTKQLSNQLTAICTDYVSDLRCRESLVIDYVISRGLLPIPDNVDEPDTYALTCLRTLVEKLHAAQDQLRTI